MKSSRDDLIDRMKTGWGCFVLASYTVRHNVNERTLPFNGKQEFFLEFP
jgi:hypothetical protein